MINLLLGAPGGGKSYEAVVFHVLPALKKGRKVITNLPLNVEAFEALDPAFADLIELRKETKAPKEEEKVLSNGRDSLPSPSVMAAMLFMSRTKVGRSPHAFGNIEDYGDAWRHPDNKVGPLYVIDECHFPLPSGRTNKDVEEWYSMHRHEGVDVLLMSQSYGKVSKDIRDLVQLVYRVRKNIAFGSDKTYTRKVQDGLRGADMNSDVRRYKKEYFCLYRSYTRGGQAEGAASDVKPIWRHWSFYGVGFMILFVFYMLVSGNAKMNILDSTPKSSVGESVSSKPVEQKKPVEKQNSGVVSNVSGNAAVQPNQPSNSGQLLPTPHQLAGLAVARSIDLLEGKNLYISGHTSTPWSGDVWHFGVAVGDKRVGTVNNMQLAKLGYEFEAVADCVGVIKLGDKERLVTCDVPLKESPSQESKRREISPEKPKEDVSEGRLNGKPDGASVVS